MRNNFIMHFCCSECGSVLNLICAGDEKVKSERRPCFDAVPKEPTGAALRAVPPVQIKPCKVCMEKYQGPAKALVDAMKAFSEVEK